MRRFLSIASFLSVTFLSLGITSFAQSTATLPGCEAAPEVRKVIDEKLDPHLLDNMKFTERVVYERNILEDLMARYPREMEPYVKYKEFINECMNPENRAVHERWLKVANQHPDDPLALTIAGMSLVDTYSNSGNIRGKDTPEGIRLLELAKSKVKASQFPWPALFLATAYSTGKRVDINKSNENLVAFFDACPGSTDLNAQVLLNKDEQLQPKVAAALRARLATETDTAKLKDYQILWALEFLAHPPREHDALRAQVAQDLKRLEALNPHGDAEWISFLIDGYKQSGAPKETITALQDRVLHDFPHSDPALDIVFRRWLEAHPEPEDQTDKPAWDKWQKEYDAALKVWIQDFPENSFYQHDAWFYAIYNDDDLTEKDGIAALDNYLEAHYANDVPTWSSINYISAAEFLINKKWQTDRAFKLIAEARKDYELDLAAGADDDNLSDEQLKERTDYLSRRGQTIDGLTLRAALLTGKTEEALKLKPSIEGPLPSEKQLQSDYWLNRARLALIEKHAQDALTYYQMAFVTRTSEPKAYGGRVDDELSDEARALWKQQGGSEAAYAFWSHPAAAAEAAKEGRWEKATKKIPDFELSDLNGKIWRLKDLNGKTVLISLWATWCGPCQTELKHLQTFYEKHKDRTDLQILTFDLDEELGGVAPFVKDKGFTFPVLPAFSTVNKLLDGWAIPQTWLIDKSGVWQSVQVGYGGGSEEDFEKEMLQHVETAKTN